MLSMCGILARAQTTTTTPVVTVPQNNPAKLAFLIPDLYGPEGLILPNPNHEAHFESDFQSNFGPFNTAIGTQLTSLPLPSTASGFTYTFDPALGVYTRSADSYGPILAERAETIGKEKFFAGFSFQHFRFSTLDGQDLHNISSVFRHSQTTPDPVIKEDIITTKNYIDAQIGQFTAFFTYGLTDRVDVSMAIPFFDANMSVVSNATIQRIGTVNDPTIHYFLDPNGNVTNQKQFSVSGSASGMGDVLARVKGTVFESKPLWISLGADIRMPTGDPYNFLGSGAAGIQPFAVVSARTRRLTPHFNFGYQINGKSPLAGNIFAGTKGHLPNAFNYDAGFDTGIDKRLSIAFDVIGQEVFGTQSIRSSTFTAADGSQYPDTFFYRKNLNMTNGSIGFKVNPVSTILLSLNVLFEMNQAGLRAPVVPLIGISKTF